MLGAPLPAARVARVEEFLVRVFQAPPLSKREAMVQGLQKRGELPDHARPEKLASFTVKAMSQDAVRAEIRKRLGTASRKIRSLSRSIRNEWIVYVVHPDDLTAEARKRRG